MCSLAYINVYASLKVSMNQPFRGLLTLLMRTSRVEAHQQIVRLGL